MDSLIRALAEGLWKLPDIEALLLFGSVSRQQNDAYSDLDFLVIVKESAVPLYTADLDWLSQCVTIDAVSREGEDSFNVLFAGGIVGDFGVVSLKHFGEYPHEAGVVVFQRENIDLSSSNIRILPSVRTQEEWLNRFLFKLYLGLGRYLRGERINAHTLIEGEALHAFLHLVKTPGAVYDPYQIDRHFESIHPSGDFLSEVYIGSLTDLPDIGRRMLSEVRSRYPIHPEFESRITYRLEECERVKTIIKMTEK